MCNPVCICSGMDPIDPKELESMRHQLEDAHRWNASLHARLGAIQSRGGGVGGKRKITRFGCFCTTVLWDGVSLLHITLMFFR